MAEKLTYRQRKSLAALMSTGTIAEAAATAGVGERTLHRWLKSEDFRTALAEAETAAVEAASRRIAAAAEVAVNELLAVLNNPTSEARERISAASAILGNLPKLRLLGGLEQAIIELQASVQL